MRSSKELISASDLRAIAFYDAASGKLFRLSGQEIGRTRQDGYVYAKLSGSRYLVHRLVWLHATGKWPTGQIDHINGNRSDNRLENLRDVCHSINLQNQRTAHRGSSSGLLGVSWRRDKEKWAAGIKVCGRQKHLGFFSSKSDAHAAYLTAKRVLHAGCVI